MRKDVIAALSFGFAITSFAITSFAILSATAADVPPKLAESSFTEAQAKRGEGLYGQYCQSCHGAGLKGNEDAPALTGDAFEATWFGRSVEDLFKLSFDTMPKDFPGELSAPQYVDLVTFLLKSDGFHAGGAELPADQELLSTIKIARAATASTLKAGDAAAGKRQFAACTACHSVDSGGPDKVGPNLHAAFGHKAAGVAGYAYSDAMKKAGLTWNAATLDKFLANPADTVPATKMAYVGVPDPQARANIIAYLEEAAK